MISNEHFKGSIHSIILFLLSEHHELYGYEITQLVKQKTHGAIKFTEGAIYPSLHKMEKKRFIQSRKQIINGRTRKYYSMTPKGATENEIQINSLNELYNAMISIFGPKLTIPNASK
jgi:DNA-binding PadR family transcriptional regulator